MVENVYGLVTDHGGLVIERIYTDLEAAGYEVAPPIVFPAAALGSIHRRDRVWICAHARHYWESPELRKSQDQRAEGPDIGFKVASYTDGTRLERPRQEGGSEAEREGERVSPGRGWWNAEPDVVRMVHGTTDRVDRIRSLGNAAIPQCAEIVGKMLLESLALS
jgi:site-specific DNA-cytosine methylase